MSKQVQEYLGHIKAMEESAADLILELINNPDVELTRDKYVLKITAPMTDEEVALAPPWAKHHYFEIWTSNGKDSLKLGYGSYDEAQVDIPADRQDEVWEALEELRLPSYEL
jgi:hypothetical protein